MKRLVCALAAVAITAFPALAAGGADISIGMPAAKVQSLLGKPDKIERPASYYDPVWHYGKYKARLTLAQLLSVVTEMVINAPGIAVRGVQVGDSAEAVKAAWPGAKARTNTLGEPLIHFWDEHGYRHFAFLSEENGIVEQLLIRNR